MKPYTPGEQYVTLGDLILTVVDCVGALVLVLVAAAALQRGAWGISVLCIVASSIALACAIIHAAMRIKR